MCQGVAYHFFTDYSRIDCDLSDELQGIEKKRHQKAYGDLMYLLTERKDLVEQYFCIPVTDHSFEELCDSLYHEGSNDVADDHGCSDYGDHDPNLDDLHLPYTLGCRFSDEAVRILYRCFVAHEIFLNLTEENLRALFEGTLSTNIKCRWSVRFGYVMHHLSVAGLIINQYQKAVGRCGYIIASGSDTPMTADCLKEAVKRARVYSGEDNVPWKRTIERDLKKLFEVMGVREAHCRNMKA